MGQRRNTGPPPRQAKKPARRQLTLAPTNQPRKGLAQKKHLSTPNKIHRGLSVNVETELPAQKKKFSSHVPEDKKLILSHGEVEALPERRSRKGVALASQHTEVPAETRIRTRSTSLAAMVTPSSGAAPHKEAADALRHVASHLTSSRGQRQHAPQKNAIRLRAAMRKADGDSSGQVWFPPSC